MTRTPLFLLALFLTTLAAVQAEPRAWSKDGIFSLIPPKGWSQVADPARNKLHFSLGQAAFEIECESQSVPIKDPAFRDQVRDSVDKCFTVLSEADTTLSGMSAIQCELQGNGEMKDFDGRFVVMTDPTTKRTWFITYSAPKPQAPEAFGAVEEALGTLQLR